MKDEYTENVNKATMALDVIKEEQRAARQRLYLDKEVAVYCSYKHHMVWLAGRCDGVYADCVCLRPYDMHMDTCPVEKIQWDDVHRVVILTEQSNDT